MNKELFEKIKEKIKSQPEHFDMGTFIDHDDAYDEEKLFADTVGDIANMKCGTTACIAGWACLLGGVTFQQINERGFSPPAKEALGIEDERLFYTCDWPGVLEQEYYDADGAEAKALAACKAIDDYIATDGWSRKSE